MICGGERNKEMLALITGGSGSGKSAYAERLVLSFNGTYRIYLATMSAASPEAASRIQRHRRMRRGKGFETIECTQNLYSIPPDKLEGADVLLEDLSNLIAGELFSSDGASLDEDRFAQQGEAAFGEAFVSHLIGEILFVNSHARSLVIVMNEIFSDSCSYDPVTEAFRRITGNLHCRIAEKADLVMEVTGGIVSIWKERG